MSLTAVTPGIPSAASEAAAQEIKENIGRALGRLASGVYIVTMAKDGQRHGIMATWVAQSSFTPPSVTIAINKERPILAMISPGSQLTINVLSEKNMNIFKNFAGPAKDGVDRFEGINIVPATQAKAPAFSEAVSYLEGTVKQIMDAGDHVIALAEITGGQLLSEENQPMVHLRKSAFIY